MNRYTMMLIIMALSIIGATALIYYKKGGDLNSLNILNLLNIVSVMLILKNIR